MWLPIVVVLFVIFVMWVGSASGVNDSTKDDI